MATQIMPQSNQLANAVSSAVKDPSMSSKEIAELVGSRHDKVKQSIERLAERGVIQLPPLGEVEDSQSLSPNNRSKVYTFYGDSGKRDSIVVVAQLSPEFTAKLVDRWQELEAQVAAPQPVAIMDPAFALMYQQMQVIGQQIQAMDALKQRVTQIDDNVKSVVEQVEAVSEQSEELAKQTESNTRQIQQIETATDHFTIIGWHRYAQQAGSLPLAEAAKMGRVATKFCKDHQIKTGTVPDPRFGTANTYPKWVLDDLFTVGHA